MIANKRFSLISQAVAATCLAAGFAISERWSVVLIILLWVLAGWLIRKASSTWAPTLLLGSAVCLAGYGVISAAPSFLIILGAAFALAGWDLALSEQVTQDATMQPENRLRSTHYRLLALALGLGLFTAVLGSAVHLPIPFGVIMLLAGLAFFALDRLARGFKGRSPN